MRAIAAIGDALHEGLKRLVHAYTAVETAVLLAVMQGPVRLGRRRG